MYITKSNVAMQALNSSAPSGLFEVAVGMYYWVIDRPGGKFAAQLFKSEQRPKFSYAILDDRPIAFGFARGDVGLGHGAGYANTAADPERPGAIIARGSDYFLKLNQPNGELMLLPLPYASAKPFRGEKIFRSWWLGIVCDGRDPVFISEKPYYALRKYRPFSEGVMLPQPDVR
jgi:hypothetical protein